MASVEAENGQTPSVVTDHHFTPFAGKPWARCCICGLSGAAHVRALDPYVTPDLTYRCPYCVDRERESCPHGQHGALDMIKATPLGPVV